MATILSSAVTIPANYIAQGYVSDGTSYAEEGYIEDLRPPTSTIFIGSTFISVKIWDDVDEPVDTWTDIVPPEQVWAAQQGSSSTWSDTSGSLPSGGWTKIYTTENPFG